MNPAFFEAMEEMKSLIVSKYTVKASSPRYAGADAGQKIASAIADLPAGWGGLVDATDFDSGSLTGFTIPSGVTVELGPTFFTMPPSQPITVLQGGRLHGMGSNSPGATTIKLGNGCNHDIITCISSGGETNWWHHGDVDRLRLLGNKANNTTGNCLSVYGLAETAVIQRINIEDAAQVGLYIKGSQSGTGSIENITTNKCGLYGTQLDEFRSGILLKSVGGDQNPITFAITNPRLGGGAITLIDPKSEGTVSADPIPIKFIGGSAKITLTIIGGNFLTPNQNKTAIQIAADVGIDPGIQIMGLFTGNHMPTLIDDLKNSQVVTTDPATYHQFFSYCGGKLARFDEAGFFTQ